MRHSSTWAARLAIVVSFGAILFGSFLPSTASSWSLWIALFSVIAVGIPHGAIDHLIAEKVYGLDTSWRSKAFFYGMYLGLMFIVGAIWLIHPVIGLIFFFLISIYHFGQADMEDFLAKGSGGSLWYVARGFLVVGLIVFTDTQVSFPIMSQAINIETAVLFAALPDSPVALSILFAAYASVFAYAWATGKLNSGTSFVIDTLVIIALFLLAGPIIGFAVYFALWHSAGHIIEMQQYLRSKNKPMSLTRFYKAATPFTLVSLAGLAVLAGINHALSMGDQFIALMFILISVLTLPHMVIVDRMYEQAQS